MVYIGSIILSKIAYKRIVSNATKCIYWASLKKGTLLDKLVLSQHVQKWWFLNLTFLMIAINRICLRNLMQHVSLYQPSKFEIYHVAIFPYIYTRYRRNWHKNICNDM